MQSPGAEEKACPFCGETIKTVAILCRFCHSDLEKRIPATQDNRQLEAKPDSLQEEPEQLVFSEGLHWLIYFWPLFWLIILLPGYFAVRSSEAFSSVYVLLLCLPLMFLVNALLTAKFTRFIVTSKKLLLKSGIVTRSTTEIPLSKIETISITQGIIGRLVGAGDLVVTGIGTSMKPLKKINDPMQFRNRLTKALETIRSQGE